MTVLSGTARFKYRDIERPVHLSLNLDDNIFEVRHSMPDIGTAMKWVSGNQAFISEAELNDIVLNTPTSVIKKDHYDDILVTSFSPGTHSIYDSTANRALSLRGKEEGVTRILIHPRSSRVEFTYAPLEQHDAQYEMFFTGSRLSIVPPQELSVGPKTMLAVGDSNGLLFRSDQSLADCEDVLRASCAVAQGGPVTTRSILEADTLVLNLCSHDGISAGPLYEKHEDAIRLLQAFVQFYAGLGASEKERWLRASYFYTQGAGGVIPIDIRAINLFTFLEMIDATDTLNKNALARLLSIAPDEADIACRVRNNLVHKGLSLGRALIEACDELARYKTSVTNNIFVIDRNDEARTGFHFFFTLLSLTSQIWVRISAFTGSVSNYAKAWA